MSFTIVRDNTVQTFRVTLTEKAITPGPSFFFRFKNELTHDVLEATLIDQSPCPARYNLFAINGGLFPSAGWYSYEARQNQPSGGPVIVEIGRMRVNDPVSDAPTEYETDTNVLKEYE